MSKDEGNEDWIKREMGRIPSKGAMAAERASAGLGTSDDDTLALKELRPSLTVWGKPRRKDAAQGSTQKDRL